MTGYLPCRDCGTELNAADLVSRLCPDCLRKRTGQLARLQQRYEYALQGGEADRAASIAGEIRAYQQAEGVRLRDVPDAYRVR